MLMGSTANHNIYIGCHVESVNKSDSLYGYALFKPLSGHLYFSDIQERIIKKAEPFLTLPLC